MATDGPYQKSGQDGIDAPVDGARSASPDLAPVANANRIDSLDFIRGVAVMGILAANIVAFGHPFEALFYPGAFLTGHGEWSDWLAVVQYVVIDNKMRGLFTLLFGAGLYLFMERAWARGATRLLQLWRLTILAGFGLFHFFIIWRGDILTYYALIGIALLPLLRFSPAVQLGLGIGGYLLGVLFYAGSLTFPYLISDTTFGESEGFAQAREGLIAGKAQSLADGRVEAALIEGGEHGALISHRLAEHGMDPLTNTMFFVFETAPLMLIGMALYRLGFFSGEFSRSKLVRGGWLALGSGAAISLGIALWMKAGGFTYYLSLAGYVGWSPLPQLLMTLGLAALMVAYSPRWDGWLAQRISAAGRVAFTNYLGTSIVMVWVFHGWGLGLYGELARPQLYLVMLGAWAVMLAWSRPWLERYRYGPLEWLWRCMTYRRIFALRR